MKKELAYEGTDWDYIYYEFQSAGIPDPRYFGDNFDAQPVHIIKAQYESLVKRDKSKANANSIAIARCGLLFGASDKLTEENFLPFPELLELESKEVKPTLSVSTATDFMRGIKRNIIPAKVIGAATPYMETILKLAET